MVTSHKLDMFASLEASHREEPAAQWLLTFTDLVALLVCFFVMLFSMKEMDSKGWDVVRGSLGGVFSIIPADEAQVPFEEPEAEQVVRKKGSVLPYLQQVLRTRLMEVPGWEKWEGRYDAERDELWYPWRGEGDRAALASVLMSWKNEIEFATGATQGVEVALEAIDDLRARGALVVREVVVIPGLSGQVWMVVKGTQ